MASATCSRGSTLISTYLYHPLLFYHASSRASAKYFTEPVPTECYTTLNVTPDSSVQEVKESYIKFARKYHPDANHKTVNSEKFAKINYAYNTIMEKLQQQQQQQLPTTDDDEKENKISSSQHRHYLSYEGFGIGTMSQREKQYNQYRMMKATEKVQEYQVKKFMYMQEDAIVLKEKKFTRKLKISNAIDRVVEDLIQEAISKGEFHNLSGSGKPLSFSNHNPMLDITTHNLNKILINNGYTPEWIVMRKDIIENLHNSHSNLAMSFIQTKGSVNAHALNQFQVGIKDVNEMIDKYNMVVPILNKQMVHYSYQQELRKVQKNPKKFIRDMPASDKLSSQCNMKDVLYSNTINWSQVWKDIRDMFK